eukprot:gene3151-3451_t
MQQSHNSGGEDFFSNQCNQLMRSMGVLVLAVGTITSTSPAYATPSKEASKLFALAEEAIDQTAQDYKKVDQVWSATKKNIHDLYQQTNQYNKQFQAIETDVQTIITRLTKLITVGEESVVKIQSELDALSKSVAEKYAIAESSANKLEKPAVTAKYFTIAQNEALILEEDTKELKSLQEIVNQHKALLNRLQTVSDHLNRINTVALVEVKNDQDNGVRDLVDGIASNLKSCRDQLNECVRGGQEGLNTFKRGVTTSTKAQEKYVSALRSLENELKALEGIEATFSQTSTKLEKVLDALKVWEDQRKLTLKLGKSLVVSYAQETKNINNQIIDRATNFNKVYSTVNKYQHLNNINTNNNGDKKDKKVSIVDQIKEVYAKLENAQKDGIRAEKMFLAAKAQGEREATVYKKLTGSTATVTTTTATTSTTTATAPANAPKGVSSK